MKDTYFVMKNGVVQQPLIPQDGLELYYDVKGKRNTDTHKDKLIDLSGNGRDATLSNFEFEGVSGYLDTTEGGLLLDDVDDKIVIPAISSIGYTSASRNIFTIDNNWKLNKWSSSVPGQTAVEATDSTVMYTPVKLLADPSTVYTLSSKYATDCTMLIEFDENNVITAATSWVSTSYTFTSNVNTKYFGIQMARVARTTLLLTDKVSFNIQLEKGSSATAYTPYVPIPRMTYQLNGNVISYEPGGIVKRVQNGEVITSKVNFFTNSNLLNVSTGTLSSKHPNTYLSGWSQYNGGISNPATSYHAHIDTDTFGFNVIEYNESDGTRNWKGSSKGGLQNITNDVGVYTISFDLYPTGTGTRIYGGFYSCLKGNTVFNFHSGQFSVTPSTIDGWVRYSANCTLHADTDFLKDVSFYLYGSGFSTNSILYAKDIKLEKSPTMTEYNIYPYDLLNTLEIKKNIVGDLENLQGNDYEQHEDGVITYTNEAEEGAVARVDIDGLSEQPLRFRNVTGEQVVISDHDQTDTDAIKKVEFQGNSVQATDKYREVNGTSVVIDPTLHDKSTLDKIYVSGYLKVTSGSANIGIFDLGNYNNKRTIGSVTSTTAFTKISDITTIQNTNGFRLDIGSTNNDVWYDDIFVCNIRLTFGEGANPTKAECDALFTNWQDKASTEFTLPELRKVGTVSDSYNPETGIFVQRIAKMAFNGTESWDSAVSNTGNNYLTALANTYMVTMPGVENVINIPLMSDNFKHTFVNNYNSGSKDSYIGTVHKFVGDNRVFIRIENSKIGIEYNTLYPASDKATAVAKWKAYLVHQYNEGTPMTVYYQLANPIVTNLGTELSIPTYKPVTLINSDSSIKGDINVDFKLRTGIVPIVGDFKSSPECINDIKDTGSSIDIISSTGKRNLVKGGQGNSRSGLFAYFNTVTDEYAEHTISSQKTYTSVNMGNGFTLGVRDYVVGSTITFSYDIMYTAWDFPVGSDRAEFWFGQRYTNGTSQSTDGAWRGVTLHGLPVVGSNGCVLNEWYTKRVTMTIPTQAHESIGSVGCIQFYNSNASVRASVTFRMRNVKIEYGSTYTPHSDALEDIGYDTKTGNIYKTDILLPSPLRSIDDLRDKLFKDFDGKWKIERKIGEKIFNGTESWSKHSYSVDGKFMFPYTSAATGITTGTGKISSSHFEEYLNSAEDLSEKTAIGTVPATGIWHGSTGGTSVYLKIQTSTIGGNNLSNLTTWITSEYSKGTPLTVQYQLATPTYETLSQDLQDKLDNIPTFPNSNYVYTVVNDNLQPTLHVDYKKLSWLNSRLLFNTLKIYSRNLSDSELIQNYKVDKDRYGI